MNKDNSVPEGVSTLFLSLLRVGILNEWIKEVHSDNFNAGWWHDPISGESLLDNKYAIATKLLLVITEISEAVEAYRKDLKDDKLTARAGIEVELADAMIRIMDIAGALNLELGETIEEKRNYNSNRKDHKIENRKNKGGKLF